MINRDELITDRTQADIDEAKKIRDEKVKSFQTLTESEKATMERGFLTVNTLNRIEQKQAELRDLLNAMGYWNTSAMEFRSVIWEADDENAVFYKEDHERILKNEKILVNAFLTYKNTPNVPSVSYGYEDINALEKILYDLDVMIEDVKSNYRICGTFNCGEE